MAEPIWQLDHVTRRGDLRPRLDDASLHITPGITAIVGPSGSGKTTLLNLLVGFESPDEGNTQFTGGRNGALSLFWSPQGAGLWAHLTLRQHLEAVTPPGSGHKVDDLLRRFDLVDRAEARPAELSLGERSRLSVARALASAAKVLVMDEPLAHVDPARIGEFWSVIREHVRAAGASLVFATHDPQIVLAEADRVVCLAHGRVLYAGEVDELYHRPPTPGLARCLGDANWIDGRCVRPEQLEVIEDAAGPDEVQSVRNRGAVMDVELQSVSDGAARTVICRTGATIPGARVVLRVLAVLLLLMWCVALPGCDSAEGSFTPRELHHFALPAEGPRMPAPRSIHMTADGRRIVLDDLGRVLVLDADHELIRSWWMPDYEVGRPEGVCELSDGRIAVADTHYHRVVLFDQAGNVLSMFGEHGEGPGQFIYPVKITQDDAGNLYVAEYGGNDRVQKFTADGRFILSFGAFGTGEGEFQRPSGLVWHEGKLYIADAFNSRIQVFTDEGEFVGILDDPDHPLALDFPYDLALGPDGLFYAAEYNADRMSVFTMDGKLVGRFGTPGRGLGQLVTPWGLAVDDRGVVWIADTGNHRVVEVIR